MKIFFVYSMKKKTSKNGWNGRAITILRAIKQRAKN